MLPVPPESLREPRYQRPPPPDLTAGSPSEPGPWSSNRVAQVRPPSPERATPVASPVATKLFQLAMTVSPSVATAPSFWLCPSSAPRRTSVNPEVDSGRGPDRDGAAPG